MARRAALRAIGWSLGLILGPLSSFQAIARTHALLIGVSEYPALSQRLQLSGPANDVQLYRALLLERGAAAADITVLADGVPQAALPSRQAILAAFATLESRVAKGDLLFVLMAGHGSQQPAGKDGREPDGLDEIFLPRDVGRWQGKQGVVENAITDDEIGGALQRLRARGAFVWAVFDTCHAGSLAREVALIRQRQAPAEALGMSAALLNAARVRSANAVTGALTETTLPIGADYVYMYAAQSSELTPEFPQPTNVPAAPVHGLFSYTLHQVLSTSTNLSYRQTIERVMQLYLANGQQSPAPQYEGSALDAAVFREGFKAAPVAWLVDRHGSDVLLRAGQLQGITAESILALVSTPTASEVLGHVQVTNATAAAATLLPVAYGGRPAPSVEHLSSSLYARPIDLKVDFKVRIGIAPGDTFCEAPRADLLQAIERVRRDPLAQRLHWPGTGRAADVYLCQRRGRVLFLDASADTRVVSGVSAPGITLPRAAASDAFVTELQQRLTRVSRVINLARVVAANRRAAQLEVTVGRCPPRADCARRGQLLQPSQRGELRDGDQLTVALRNTGSQAIDVTVLYVDAAYGINLLYPFEAGESPRLLPGNRQQFEVAINAQPSGFERLLILTAPAEPMAGATSFASLAQAALPLQPVRSATAGNLLDLLQEAAFGTSAVSPTRAPALSAPAAVGITTYSWTVLPR